MSLRIICFFSFRVAKHPTRSVLIFNPGTGMLLGDEQIATTQVGNGPIDPLGVRIPAVLDYHAYIAAGHVPDTHTQL